MIQLSADAATQAQAALNLPSLPTHAQIVGLHTRFTPHDATAHSITAEYMVGTITANSTFVPLSTGSILFSLNLAQLQTTALAASERTRRSAMLANVLGAGAAPDPADPTKTVSMPNKKAGDCKRGDVEILASLLDPRLQGSVV